MGDLDFRVAELERRVASIITHGIVSEVDPVKALVKVNLGDRESGWLPWFTARANGSESRWDAPEVGECVSVFAPFGDMALARVLGAVYSQNNPAPAVDQDLIKRLHDDGASQSYDRATHTHIIHLPSAGTFKIMVGTTVLTLSDGVCVIEADTVELGGAGGAGIARIGDQVDPNTHKITGGSSVVKAT